ncbi:hypothetical protein Bbelb_276060 [Branchiostoma belcheri]|nr:hypothetical protein Bbelb_276060 [Branchiostoma belcheri]
MNQGPEHILMRELRKLQEEKTSLQEAIHLLSNDRHEPPFIQVCRRTQGMRKGESLGDLLDTEVEPDDNGADDVQGAVQPPSKVRRRPAPTKYLTRQPHSQQCPQPVDAYQAARSKD